MAATDTKQIIKDAEAKMNAAVQHLDDELARIRAGKASARILDNVRVTYYGDLAPLSNVASVTKFQTIRSFGWCSRFGSAVLLERFRILLM